MSYIGKIKTPDNTTYLIGSTLYGTCSTAASTAAKVVTLSDFNALTTGVTIHVKFTYSNTASSPTLNVNSTGAIAIKAYGTTNPGTGTWNTWRAGQVVSFTYDGTYWMMNDYCTDQYVYQGVTTTNADYEVLFSNTADNTNRTEGARKNSNLKFNPSTGNLQSTKVSVGTNSATIQYNLTTQSIDFIFN